MVVFGLAKSDTDILQETENKKMDQRIKVLIADENNDFRHAIRENLIRAGIDVVDETDSGFDVLTKIKRSTPDVVIIDVWLPSLDAVQVIKKSKTLFQNPANIPDFIVISYCSNPNIFAEAIEAGAAYCMGKPFEYATLIERIARIYKNRQSAYKNQIMNGIQYAQERPHALRRYMSVGNDGYVFKKIYRPARVPRRRLRHYAHGVRITDNFGSFFVGKKLSRPLNRL